MGPPKGLRRLIPLPGKKLNSSIVSTVSKPVDQPLVEETQIPSPLKPINVGDACVDQGRHS